MAQLVPRGRAQARPTGHARHRRTRRSRIRSRTRRAILLRGDSQGHRRPRRAARLLHEADTVVGVLRGGVHPRGIEQHERVRSRAGEFRLRSVGDHAQGRGGEEGYEAQGIEERTPGEFSLLLSLGLRVNLFFGSRAIGFFLIETTLHLHLPPCNNDTTTRRWSQSAA